MRRLAYLIPFFLVGCGDLITVNEPSAKPDNIKALAAPKQVANLKDSRLEESSGLAAATDGARYFTHNDSGDSARFFSFRVGSGDGLSEYDVANAKSVDWEDMAVAVVRGKPFVFLADIGDNSGKRSSVQIYRVPEPGHSGSVRADETYDLTYPDGAHNSEAIIVDGARNRLQLIVKTTADKAGVYEAALSRPGSQTMKKVGSIEIGGFIQQSRLVTGATLSPDGQYIAVRTYMAGYRYLYRGHESDWFKQRPGNIPLAITAQGEAIAYSRDGETLLTTSEGSPCPVHEIDAGR